MAPFDIRSKIVSSFKLNGLSLRSEASKLLVEVLSEVEEDCDVLIPKIIDIVQKQPLTSTFIDRDVIEIAINECNQDGEEDGDRIFNIVDAFRVPHYIFNNDRKKFVLSGKTKRSLFGTPEDKADMFIERYSILYQRALHHDLFSTNAIAASSNTKSAKFTLKPVEHLLGCSGNLGDVIVLGMLCSLKEGKYYLEDPTGTVELDLSKTSLSCWHLHRELFRVGGRHNYSGSYDDQIFHVSALGFPPPEPAKSTRTFFGNVNFFGGPSTICVANSEKLQTLEQDEQNQSSMFVFLSDLWLDQPKVVAKFKVLLSGYSQMPPALFVICGNFLSQPYGSKHLQVLRSSFQELGNIISDFPSLIQNSRFYFVPGPQDPGPGNILPRPPISKHLTEELKEKIPFCEFVTNPCRLQYCSQEIVIYREDIINKMCRNGVHLPEDLQNIPTHFVKTIMSQAHLCPVSLNSRPIYWAFDNALRLYPLPDLIVCADKFDAYNINHAESTCINPGSFSKSDFCFKVYWPASKEIEDCKID